MCKWLGRNCIKLIAFVIIICILIFSGIVIKDGFYKSQQLVSDNQNQSPVDVQDSSAQTSFKIEVSSNEAMKNVVEFTNDFHPVGSKNQYVIMYHVLLVAYLCVLAVTLIVLFIIVFKDDNGIRYEKLNELKSVKHNLIKNFDSRVCNTDTIKTESNSFCCNNQSLETNITNTRNVKEELIKHYMTCITEL